MSSFGELELTSLWPVRHPSSRPGPSDSRPMSQLVLKSHSLRRQTTGHKKNCMDRPSRFMFLVKLRTVQVNQRQRNEAPMLLTLLSTFPLSYTPCRRGLLEFFEAFLVGRANDHTISCPVPRIWRETYYGGFRTTGSKHTPRAGRRQASCSSPHMRAADANFRPLVLVW